MNKKQTNTTNYGVYIEQTHAVIVALHDGIAEETDLLSPLISAEGFQGQSSDNAITRVSGHSDIRESEHQNKLRTEMKKFCKEIIARLKNADSILIFGPAATKFELQKALKATKSLKGLYEELETTDQMTSEEVVRYVKQHFAEEKRSGPQTRRSTADRRHEKPGTRGKLLRQSGKIIS